jgi:hypothetical protein
MKDSDWEIRRGGRAWRAGEAHERYELTPEKLALSARDAANGGRAETSGPG